MHILLDRGSLFRGSTVIFRMTGSKYKHLWINQWNIYFAESKPESFAEKAKLRETLCVFQKFSMDETGKSNDQAPLLYLQWFEQWEQQNHALQVCWSKCNLFQ